MKNILGVSAEWYFFATSHCKSAYDTLGGIMKILAGRVSLQQPYTYQNMTPRQLFSWAQTNTQKHELWVCYWARIHRRKKVLFRRNSAAKPLLGTLKLHAFLPIWKCKLIVKRFSTSAESEECCVTVLRENMTLDARGFVTCVWQCLVVRMRFDSEWKLNGSDNQFSPTSWSIAILCVSSAARHTENSFVRSFNEGRSKNSYRMNIYFSICWNTVNDWEVEAQEKLLLNHVYKPNIFLLQKKLHFVRN
jgi:hypothetical protein